MPSQREDPRIAYTKNALHTALISLMKKKSVDRITVKELCEEARINRGTYYLHYESVSDVLKEVEEELFTSHMEKLVGLWGDFPLGANAMTTVFQEFQSSKDVFLTLFGPNGDRDLQQKLQETFRPTCLERWKAEYPEYDTRELDVLYTFVYPGSMSLFLSYLQDPRGFTLDEFCERLALFGEYCLKSLAMVAHRQ